MKFERVVSSVSTFHDLKRIASAHVVDHVRLDAEELRSSILRTTNQYTHPEAVRAALECALYEDNDLDHRVLAEAIVVDVLMDEHGHLMPLAELEEKVSQFEQSVLNESNEQTLRDLAGGNEDSPKGKNLSLYNFVLDTAWKHQDSKSVDEANLLRKLRGRLGITAREHRLLEARLGKYPKDHNELHSRTEITEALRTLETLGLVFMVRDENGTDFVAIPEEIAQEARKALGIEMRRAGYQQLLQSKHVRSKAYLQDVLAKHGIDYGPRDTVEQLQERVLDSVPPSELIGGTSPRDGLNSEDLHKWCSELGLPVAGSKAERIARIIEHYDQLELLGSEEGDTREIWYHFYEQLARRNIAALRAQHVIEKDIEIERYFEEATSFLFEVKLNHKPLRQAGTEHADGTLSYRDTWILWDNKSKETPVNLRDHLKQFHRYMEKAEKPVPIFIVVGPEFTEDSEAAALEYTSENLGRNVALVRAADLKELADIWASDDNRRNAEPFPLGLFARPGLFSLSTIRNSLG
jgi:hypothetical protein